MSAIRSFIAGRLVTTASVTASLLLAPSTAVAQVEDVRIYRGQSPGVSLGVTVGRPAEQRAVLGVTLATPEGADTAGIRVETVDPDGPAGRAGIRSGDLLLAVHGTSLRLSLEDARDPAMRGVQNRRLQRVLAGIRPGDTVRVDVRTGSAPARLIRVVTISAAALADAGRQRGVTGGRASESVPGRRPTSRVIGVMIGASGTPRDTLGLFVSQVTPNGPADRAGIIEGDRIAAINGADVRIPAEDVEDHAVGTSRADRFVRAIADSDSGRSVVLRVIRGGQSREVRVVPEADTVRNGMTVWPPDPAIGNRFRIEGQRLRDSLDSWQLRLERELPAVLERTLPRLELRMRPSVVRGTRIIV